MKTIRIISILVSIVCLTQMANAQTDTSLSFGVRQHAEQPDFPDISFGDGDISYGLALTAGDGLGYWQGALLYTPDIEGIDDLDYALTPQLNLILKEKLWRMGVGGAATYISSDSDSGWNDFFWQLMLGLGLPPMGKVSLEAHAIYIFDEWGNIGDFDVDNLEYAVWMGVKF
jgi:hypothetical protein